MNLTNRRGLVAYAVAGLVTLAIVRSQDAPLQALPFVVLALGAIPLALLRRRPTLVIAGGIAAVAAVAIVLAGRGALPPRPYGDGQLLATFLTMPYVFPRWLLGMALAIALYIGVWQFPPIAGHLSPQLASPATFAALLCALTMAVTSVAIADRWRRLSVAFAMLTPVWLLFSSGYVEYYPLMIGAWLAALAWTFERPLAERHPVAIGAVVGILPAVYVGFIGFSVALLIAYTVARPRAALAALGAAAASLALAIAVASPGIPQFLRQLYAEMNFGDDHSLPKYIGLAASPRSIFFKTSYALSAVHLREVAYMLVFGGGWLFVPLLVFGAVRSLFANLEWREARIWLGATVVVWQLTYVFWMIPKAGPRRDVDLFCPTFVAVAFFAGELLESSRWAYPLLCAAVAVDVVTATYLAWIGL